VSAVAAHGRRLTQLLSAVAERWPLPKLPKNAKAPEAVARQMIDLGLELW